MICVNTMHVNALRVPRFENLNNFVGAFTILHEHYLKMFFNFVSQNLKRSYIL